MARFYPTGGTGGANVSVVTALAEDVAKGKVIVGPDGKPITGTLELTGTAAEVVGVVSVDDRMIGDGKVGINTKRIMEEFKKYINKVC